MIQGDVPAARIYNKSEKYAVIYDPYSLFEMSKTRAADTVKMMH